MNPCQYHDEPSAASNPHSRLFVEPALFSEDIVRCTLWGAHPRNHLQRNSSFGTVWRWKANNQSRSDTGETNGCWVLLTADVGVSRRARCHVDVPNWLVMNPIC